MRVLVELRIDSNGPHRVNKTLFQRTGDCLKYLGAETVYYGFHNDCKAVYAVLDVLNPDNLPANVEPLCMHWNIGMDFAPPKAQSNLTSTR